MACRFMLRRLLLALEHEAQSSIRQKLPRRPEESWWRLALIDRSTREAVHSTPLQTAVVCCNGEWLQAVSRCAAPE